MSKIEIEIDSTDVDGTSGHITVKFHVVETLDDGTEVKGLPDRRGIHPIGLVRRYGTGPDNIDKWLADVKAKMTDQYNNLKVAYDGLAKLQGKKRI